MMKPQRHQLQVAKLGDTNIPNATVIPAQAGIHLLFMDPSLVIDDVDVDADS